MFAKNCIPTSVIIYRNRSKITEKFSKSPIEALKALNISYNIINRNILVKTSSF